ncbi:MAG: tetratricopeptide repeat protein [Firmicutes bacterium]|nr:tetratricopeptide repeat protein [Bacillota bacterium]
MDSIFSFMLLARLLGHPLAALVIVLVVYWAANRSLSGWLPGITRSIGRAAQIRRLRNTVALNPADAKSLMELGVLLFEAGRPDEAVVPLEQAVSKMDDHAHALYYLGATYAELGRGAEASEVLRKAIALRPEVAHGRPYVYLVQLTDVAKTASATAEEIETWTADALRYGDAETCYRLGTVLVQAKKNEKARRAFSEAVDHYRRSPGFVRRTARIWALRSRMSLRKLGYGPDGGKK